MMILKGTQYAIRIAFTDAISIVNWLVMDITIRQHRNRNSSCKTEGIG